jgi:hypothetical protein
MTLWQDQVNGADERSRPRWGLTHASLPYNDSVVRLYAAFHAYG